MTSETHATHVILETCTCIIKHSNICTKISNNDNQFINEKKEEGDHLMAFPERKNWGGFCLIVYWQEEIPTKRRV